MLSEALPLAGRGFSVLPLSARGKKPIMNDWPKLATSDPETIRAWFAKCPDMNFGVATGKPSGVFVLDVDGEKGKVSLAELEARNGSLPATVECRTGSGGRHLYFRMPKSGDVRNKQSFRPGLDIRGTGGQVVAPPSIHPNGTAYAWTRDFGPGEIDLAPAPAWLLAMIAPDEQAPPVASPAPAAERKPSPWERQTKTPAKAPTSPASTPIIERARLYLQECEPAVQGQAGHDKLLWAARALVVGFELDEGTAMSLLWSDFNPRCMPPWNRETEGRDFERKVREVARTPGTKPRGWLLDELGLRGHDENLVAYGQSLAAGLLASEKKPTQAPESAPVEDMPEILSPRRRRAIAWEEGEADDSTTEAKDPGQTPDRLLRVPGFVSDVMDWTMNTAPVPNLPLAFAGALALQALLAGRKVRDPGDIRTNLYLVALASSGSGKEWPRKVNKSIAFRCGFFDQIGDRFASAEGIEDALVRNQARLYQTDEMDSLLQSIAKKSGDPKLEAIQAMLLTLVGEANSMHIQRDKAGDSNSGSISQPHVVLFGTAIPVFFYGALSERMMTNGLLSRLIILDSTSQRRDQDAGSIDNPPDRIVDVAKFWTEFSPGGDLGVVNPVPAEVKQTQSAKKILSDLRADATRRCNGAEEDDETTRAVWSRVNEQGRKLALLHAVSANHESPTIDDRAALWGSEFAQHQASRMLAMVGRHGATSQFEKDCRLFLAKLNAAPNRRLPRADILKRMKSPAKQFDEWARTLLERGDVDIESVQTPGRPAVYYIAKGRKTKG